MQYNIIGVNLATGGSAHTTFLTCVPNETKAGLNPPNETKAALNPYRERLEIQERLSNRVRELYEKYNKELSLADPVDEPVVRVTFAHPRRTENRPFKYI